MGQPIRILIVDDHDLFRETLAHSLASEPDMVVVVHYATVAETLTALLEQPVDLVLLDYNLRTERCSALLNQAAADGFKAKFLIVTAGLSETDAVTLIQKQVSGIFLKEHPLTDLLAAIRTVAQGGKWLDQPYLKMVMSALADDAAPLPAPIFTQRELEILRNLVSGCTNKEIGEKLGLSESAVKSAVQRLFDKVGVRGRGHLIRIALQKYQAYL
jgi:two-component system, NarL family, nitrate/nitrite response regulator NarL